MIIMSVPIDMNAARPCFLDKGQNNNREGFTVGKLKPKDILRRGDNIGVSVRIKTHSEPRIK